MEHGESFTNCIKIGEKTITINGKVIRCLRYTLFANNFITSPGDRGLHRRGLRSGRGPCVPDEMYSDSPVSGFKVDVEEN